MPQKIVLLSAVAAISLAGCASPETLVLKPYRLANGDTYQDVVSIGANKVGSAPVVTQIKTFHLDPGSKSHLVTDASGSQPGLAAVMAGGVAQGAVMGGVLGRVGASATATATGIPVEWYADNSDRRLKRDVVAVGRLENGLTLYRFRYLWSDEVYVGVMAQEVLKVAPVAVIFGDDGYMRVNYSVLGLRMFTWDEWVGRRRGTRWPAMPAFAQDLVRRLQRGQLAAAT